MKKYGVLLAQLGIFTGLLFFFCRCCPLILYDADDWIYIAYKRIPLPIWGGWNPSRVFPETFMPLVGRISAKLVFPLTGDYVLAVMLVSAFMCALLITAMCYLVYRVLHHRYGYDKMYSVQIEILFLVYCFLIFRNRGGSCYLFNASSICCTYFYTFSGLLNAVVILLMLQYEDFEKAFRHFRISQKLLFGLGVYFSIFSNLFHSGMLAVYAGIQILTKTVTLCRTFGVKKGCRCVWKESRSSVIILLTWIVAVIFELSGGRASRVGTEQWNLVVAKDQLFALLEAMNKVFALLAVLAILLVGVRLLQKKLPEKFRQYVQTDQDKVSVEIMLAANIIILTIYELLLNAKVPYMSRIEASWGIWFYVILFVTLVLSGTVYNSRSWYPVICGVLVILAVYPDGKYMNSNIHDTEAGVCMATSQLAVEPILEAAGQDMEAVEVRIPDYSGMAQAWGFGENYGQLVANALFANGIIDEPITVTTILDADMNGRITP